MFPTITLNSMYEANPNIFKHLNFKFITYYDTQGDSIFYDAATLIDTIIFNYGEMGIIYPNAELLEKAIKFWSIRNKLNILRLWNVCISKYNPIWNKDGKITETRTPNITRTVESNGSASSSTSGESENNNSRQGFNSDSYNPVNHDESSDKGESNSESNSNSTERETGSETIVREEGGNIGVTKTQEMIADEIALWTKENFYEIVARKFALDFCILLY